MSVRRVLLRRRVTKAGRFAPSVPRAEQSPSVRAAGTRVRAEEESSMRKLVSGACAFAAGLALVVAGCGGSDDKGSGATTSAGQNASGAIVAKAQKGLDALKTTVLSTGPNGEK